MKRDIMLMSTGEIWTAWDEGDGWVWVDTFDDVGYMRAEVVRKGGKWEWVS